MKNSLKQILIRSAAKWSPLPEFEIERPKVKAHGELSTNLAMILGRKNKQNPQALAKEIVEHLADPEGLIESVIVAGGGFLNFTFKREAWHKALREMMAQGGEFGKFHVGNGKKIVIEFVSANPTGPLHIGNARGGPLGDVIASLLEKAGYDVTREYYVNDVGGQIDKLGASILHWIKAGDQADVPPPEGYQGEYVRELARLAQEKIGHTYRREDEKNAIPLLGLFGIDCMLQEIRRDCEDMGIRFDSWVYEKDVLGSGETEAVLQALQKKNVTKQAEGALWYAPQDDFLKDRECVLRRTDGRPTYFANDIAYHENKYRRGYDRLINIWGSNHHGHVPRLQAAMRSLGYDPEKMETVLYQYVRVKRGADAVKMSKRGGNFVTAREVLDEVGRDAFRFFLLMRAPESHLDFDLELAKKNSQENPVYYIQYAHARLASILRKAGEMNIPLPDEASVHLEFLELPEETDLIRMIGEYPDELLRAAQELAPHRVSFYLLELAKLFQAYYAKAKEDSRYRVLSQKVDTSQAKLYLCLALKHTLSQGLKLLGITAPEVMTQQES